VQIINELIVVFQSDRCRPCSFNEIDLHYLVWHQLSGAQRSSFNNIPHMPFLREAFEHEPAVNFAEQEALFRTPTGDSLRSDRSSLDSLTEGLRRFSDGSSLRHYFFHTQNEKPSDDHNIHDIEFNAVSR
jgi:hypothetical protein